MYSKEGLFQRVNQNTSPRCLAKNIFCQKYVVDKALFKNTINSSRYKRYQEKKEVTKITTKKQVEFDLFFFDKNS